MIIVPILHARKVKQRDRKYMVTQLVRGQVELGHRNLNHSLNP